MVKQIDRRYQVFVSSTYEDLQKERQEVMQALLELDCIPSGMELFPAADEDQWTLIKGVIDDCDYYIVIVAGRYGSIGTDGRSFTEMEYRYALEQGKPTIAFLHKDPGTLPANMTEQDPEAKKKLESFREFVRRKMVKRWSSPEDLGSVVSRSLIRLTRDKPAVGWVRADLLPDENATEEILQLRKRVDQLEAELELARTQAPEGSQDFAQGDDEFKINYVIEARTPDIGGISLDLFEASPAKYDSSYSATWNQIFAAVSPIMIDESREWGLNKLLKDFVRAKVQEDWDYKLAQENLEVARLEILDSDFQTIKVQLRALGLITESRRSRSVKDTETYWTLTPYGDTVMTNLRAIRRSQS